MNKVKDLCISILLSLFAIGTLLYLTRAKYVTANLISTTAPCVKTATDKSVRCDVSGKCAVGDNGCSTSGGCPITMNITAERLCTGYHVSNEVYIYGDVGSNGFTAQGYSFLLPSGVALLNVEHHQVCVGEISSETIANSPCPSPTATPTPTPVTCPTPPASRPKPAENCTWHQRWCTWICDFDDCNNFGYQWNFTTGKCNSTAEDCELDEMFWNFSNNTCNATPACEACVQNDDCCYGEVCVDGQCGAAQECDPVCTGEYFCFSGICSDNTPVLIDVDGDGFDLTSWANGSYFDLNADGVAHKVSWTKPTSDDAWLVLDRNGNGTIDSGRELFGNQAPQSLPPGGSERNGFHALAEFDKSQNGGNQDGVISASDAVFRRLRLWQDHNHNGASEPTELFRLQALGLRTIDLRYRKSARSDVFGNQFKYRAKVTDADGAQLGRWACDVILISGP